MFCKKKFKKRCSKHSLKNSGIRGWVWLMIEHLHLQTYMNILIHFKGNLTFATLLQFMVF